MNEFQFSISYEGRFVFRTDWIDASDVMRVQAHLKLKFARADGYKLVATERSKLQTHTEVQS